MSSRTEELTLLLKARNLADGAVQGVTSGLDKVVTAGGRVKEAMQGLGGATAIGLGMAAETLASGGSLIDAASQLGLHMVSELTETFGGQLIERLTSSSLLAAITAPISAVGSAIGGIISAAIPIGMALLPVLLVGAIVAAVVFLANNPEILGKIADFVGGVVQAIVRFMGELVPKLIGLWVSIWANIIGTARQFVLDVVGFLLSIPGRLVELGGMIVRTIIGGLVSLPGKIADVIRDAFRSLKIDIGPFHISAAGVTIDLPKFSADEHTNYHLTGQVPQYQHGGVAGRYGPELALVGEKEPELITPLSKLGGQGGAINLTLMLDTGVLVRAVLPIVSRELYYELATEAPSSGRA